MNKQPRGVELISEDDLNVDLESTDGRRRDEDIAEMVETAGLEDMSVLFLPRRRTWCKYCRTWVMLQQERVVRSHTDYILGFSFRIFHNVDVQDPRHNSDHFVFMGCLRGSSLREPSHYLGSSMCLPIQLPGIRQGCRQTIHLPSCGTLCQSRKMGVTPQLVNIRGYVETYQL